MLWSLGEDGYRLGFNRDEKWTRARSADPRVEWDPATGLRGLCARDPAAGGTWLYVNEDGLCVALMNAYPPSYTGYGAPGRPHRSRGKLPLLVAGASTGAEVMRELGVMCWMDYAPCDVLVWTPAGPGVGERACCHRWRWDGERAGVSEERVEGFLTSSSVDTVAVVAARTARCEELQRRHATLEAVLGDTVAELPSHAVYVTRGDGGTVSQSFVTVTRDSVSLSVARRGERGVTLTLPRRG
jgi:Transport and Golgi organisation 2